MADMLGKEQEAKALLLKSPTSFQDTIGSVYCVSLNLF